MLKINFELFLQIPLQIEEQQVETWVDSECWKHIHEFWLSYRVFYSQETLKKNTETAQKEREEVMRWIKEYRSLDNWRKIADKKEGDLVWEKGLLIKKKIDDVGRDIRLIVVPKSYMERLLALAHDRTGHLGSRKTGQILARQLIWPCCGADVARYCRSCQVYQKANKTGNRKAPMVARPALTQPFESVAFDLVGPMPKGKGGHRFILAYLPCNKMATSCTCKECQLRNSGPNYG